MAELLISIPGPQFLLLFAVISIFILIIAKLLMLSDSSRNLAIPEPTTLSALDISILKDRETGAIEYSIFNLWRQGGLSISHDRGKIHIKKKGTKTQVSNALETKIQDFARKEQKYQDFFTKNSEIAVSNTIKSNLENLKELKLIPDDEINRYLSLVFRISLSIILILGTSKLYFGITRDKPIFFLVILLIAVIITFFYFLSPVTFKTTSLGDKFLENTGRRFEWLKASKADRSILSDENLAYGVAVFGLIAFAGTNIGTLLKDPFLITSDTLLMTSGTWGSTSGGSYYGSGGSSSDSGGSGNGGGSSDGGGGCGGGGCGGCGS